MSPEQFMPTAVDYMTRVLAGVCMHPDQTDVKSKAVDGGSILVVAKLSSEDFKAIKFSDTDTGLQKVAKRFGQVRGVDLVFRLRDPDIASIPFDDT